jgi:hypothetical protein
MMLVQVLMQRFGGNAIMVKIMNGVARCLVTFKLLNTDGSITVRTVDNEKDKDLAIQKIR